ncbi:A disintegrin and metalloproteinase with thrombospondin motifs adt-2-like isoform X1 [Leptopilina boulardi]|uniref:A disintegrin and metalloproteinase with thrombospondin motifs adt-2-like isoform X1 n=1 Tax=Leptopilina boulardi TaxID=63433 RepID=UPI0021F62611|nr:A disintegrin and metalloproteinase with thrombospondin motifs adt-2-like isoform X1 [Leptopilina boulardi]
MKLVKIQSFNSEFQHCTEKMNYFIILFGILFVSLTQSFIVDDDYEVVQIRHKRDDKNKRLTIQMQKRRQLIQFYLYPTDRFIAGSKTKVYTVRNVKNNVMFTYQPKVMQQMNLKFYQNPRTSSSITHSVDKNGKSRFTGHINNNIILRPMPNHLRQRRDLLKTNSSFFENDAEGFINTDEHIIYEKSFNDSIPHSSPNVFDDKFMKIKSVNRRDVSKTPNIVYPEILVYVDELLFKKFNYDMMKAVEYTLGHWNGVDLRYRQFQKPKIRLYVAGIVLIQNTLPFVHKTLLSNGLYNAELLLQEFAKFLYKNTVNIQPMKDYDISMYMSGKLLYIINEKRETTGYAYTGKPCVLRNSRGMYMSSGVVFDKNDYGTILTTVHELGHILGAPHDEQNSNQNGPSNTMRCLKKEGYVMSYNKYNKNKISFSPCSVKAIVHTLSQDFTKCLRNNPAVYKDNYPLRRLLPGQIMSLDEQCKKMGFYQCAHKKTTCLLLVCSSRNKYGQLKDFSHMNPPAEGSNCAPGRYCIAGQCEFKV